MFPSDHKLHGRTRGWTGLIWNCISGDNFITISEPKNVSDECAASVLRLKLSNPQWYEFVTLFLSSFFFFLSQAKCLETGETVAIKKVLQDKRYKNRELQTMRLLDHPNVVSLKHCFFSTTDKDELYLNLVLEFVPETIYRVAKHYSRANQRMPLIYVKLYTYQVICAVILICYLDFTFFCSPYFQLSLKRVI